MLNVPIKSAPSQNLQTVLAGQQIALSIYTLSTGLYMDVQKNNVPVATGVICHDRNKIVRAAYTGFIGDFIFVDTQGKDDPVYSGLGSRFLLTYLEASDL